MKKWNANRKPHYGLRKLLTVTRKVTIIEPGLTPQVQNQTATFQKTTDTDLVTKHQTETYDHDTKELTSVTVPTVPGYTVSQTSVLELTVKPTDLKNLVTRCHIIQT